MKNQIIKFLKANQHRDVNRTELLDQAHEAGVYSGVVYDVLKELENIAHIGQWWDTEKRTVWLRYYQPNELTDKVQECLARGDNW